MQISESRQGNVMILEISGRLDTEATKPFEISVLQHLDEGEEMLVLDMGGVDYINSSCLRVVLMAAKRLHSAHGRLALCALGDTIREVFDVSGFSRILEIHPSRSRAVASMH
ncbi:STAS domain-containing protein [Marinibaculum pumilum]|uniref:Anti-sigma factor antagonist n=1 Tax=Marinibaculum pumilum TaxID=1766165 RepID=A0ABV7L794_9PROT